MSAPVPKAYLRRIGSEVDHKYIYLEEEEVIIGRAKEATYNIPSLHISRRHAVLRYENDHWTIENVGMNGVSINHRPQLKHHIIPLEHLDTIEFGADSKFVYTFRFQTGDNSFREPDPKKIRVPLQDRAHLQVPLMENQESPQSFNSYMMSKRNLERALVEESAELDEMLLKQNSHKDKIIIEQQKLAADSLNRTQQLESTFLKEKNELEARVNRGELAISDLQREKEMLQQRMEECLQALKVECSRRTIELEEMLARSNQEKQSLLEEKEIIVQQLQREKEFLEDELEEERRMSTFAKNELMQLKTGSEVRERMIQEDQHKFEEERRKLLEQSVEAQKRIEQLEQEKLERDRHLEDIKARLDAKEQQVADIQNQAPAGVDILEAILNMNTTTSSEELYMIVEDQNSTETSGDMSSLADTSSSMSEELMRMREELRVSQAEKEEIRKQMEDVVAKARNDAVIKLENVVENELQCGICSELYVKAITLNCMHTFCQFCINLWKEKKRDCPICRTAITSESRSLVLDSAIDGIVTTLSEQVRNRRKELLSQRSAVDAKVSNDPVVVFVGDASVVEIPAPRILRQSSVRGVVVRRSQQSATPRAVIAAPVRPARPPAVARQSASQRSALVVTGPAEAPRVARPPMIAPVPQVSRSRVRASNPTPSSQPPQSSTGSATIIVGQASRPANPPGPSSRTRSRPVNIAPQPAGGILRAGSFQPAPAASQGTRH